MPALAVFAAKTFATGTQYSAEIPVAKGITDFRIEADRSLLILSDQEITIGLELSIDGGKSWADAGSVKDAGGPLPLTKDRSQLEPRLWFSASLPEPETLDRVVRIRVDAPKLALSLGALTLTLL